MQCNGQSQSRTRNSLNRNAGGADLVRNENCDETTILHNSTPFSNSCLCLLIYLYLTLLPTAFLLFFRFPFRHCQFFSPRDVYVYVGIHCHFKSADNGQYVHPLEETGHQDRQLRKCIKLSVYKLKHN